MAIVDMSAREMAAAVRAGEISAREVVEAHLGEIAAHDHEVSAFLLVLEDEARRRASEIDAAIARGEEVGPLAGVPIAVKDNMALRGVETTCASRILAGWRPPYTATVLERIEAAGAIVIGKTNLDEFAMGSSTENSGFFATRNPVDPSRVPGGSSGGSAAAVAARFAPLALGSDTGGSIRQPASLCGVVGAKPTYGLVSRYGLIAFASSLDQIGPFARSVEDAAALLAVIASQDPKDSTSLAAGFDASEITSGVRGMRIGVVEEMLDGVSPGVSSVLDAAIAALVDAGATVERVSVPAARFGLSAYYLIAPAEASSNLARFDGVRFGLRVEGEDITETYLRTREKGFGAEVKRRIMLGTYALSAGYYDALYGKAQQVRTLIARDFAAAYERFDALISPTSPTVAFRFGERSDPLSMYMSDVCTIPSNLAGHPGMSVPFGAAEDGMPAGVQVFAPALGEGTMFRVAMALEASAAKPAVPVWRSAAAPGGAA
ncbi:MAG: Asp-tRNA(Asn)/Glu-tRNA(Gln) amidotransferase subunit GatA [Nitrospiraceae bacterium]|nr:Asp-tRNA(Asn)/Glu-tRNA(Gln) amidotransferase subunit GatA [Nitrospiraceae bacterium]MDA8261818.1 Asp-tRNA(Asn)/Glu-tRNA(Gln) amidotransferase subunit GatA [Actinomycetota bacterium]